MQQPTFSRKGSARPVSRGTVQVGAVGVAAQQSVEITDRPMSTHGMTGTRAVTGTRQVRDSTYFATELRNRIAQTNKEIDALKNSTAELRKREQISFRLLESVQELRKQVAEHQGELHDITYSQSRFKEGASLDDLRNEAAAAEEEAKKHRNEANIAFKAREEALQRLEKNEATAAKLRADTEQRIYNDLGDDAARQFRELNQENNALQVKEQELRKQLTEQANITAQAYAAAFVLQSKQNQQNIQKAIDLHRQIRTNKREIEQLRAELSKDSSEDPEFSIKQQLKNQIKIESTDCKKLLEEIKQIDVAVQNRKRLLTEITPDVMTAITKEQKDMIKNVLKAERQLGDWPRQKAELVADNQRLQGQTMSLLARLPSPMARTEGADAVGVEVSLGQKTRELERLSDQEAKVLMELQQVNGTVQQLTDTLASLQQAMGDAEAVQDVESAESDLKRQLSEQVEEHKQLQQQLAQLNQEMNEVEEQVASNENVQTLRNLFDSLSQNLAKQYIAESYIRNRENETNYQRDKLTVLQLLDAINGQLSSLGMK